MCVECQFVASGDGIKCAVCGFEIAGFADTTLHAPCRAMHNQRARLGDYTEHVLLSIGITPDRYAAAKSLFGLAPGCNCAARKEWLNRVSDWWRGEDQ